MRIERRLLESLVFGAGGGNRFTQDSPVMPDVWFGFGVDEDKSGTLDLLFDPKRGVPPTKATAALRQEAEAKLGPTWPETSRVATLAYDESHVVARMDLAALVRAVLPLTGWWHTHAGRLGGLTAKQIEKIVAGKDDPKAPRVRSWFLKLLGTLVWAQEQESDAFCRELPGPSEIARPLARLLRGLSEPGDLPARKKSKIWSVHRNRPASIAVWTSAKTIKVDAATRLFSLSCDHLTWAIIDTGVDATHPAFRRRTPNGKLVSKKGAPASLSRVVKTYDFTKIRDLLHKCCEELPEEMEGATVSGRAAELRRRLRAGQSVNWELLEPLLEVKHTVRDYRPPRHPHGTHVAGILAANWRRSDAGYDAHSERDMVGVCPGIQLYDLRVLDENGKGDEFSILAALQFVRYLNSHRRRPVIQGVNLSLSIPHDVSNFACGRTPVCEEAERLHGSGVVVVAAAGNKGHVHYLVAGGQESEAYKNISITDPGNARSVLTVGATHRAHPHTYGVSYFSSRGPTGDGRVKPDIVAPGEKITGPAPHEGVETMDGTSMAAPHVSGAAALIMARHSEFIGDPERIARLLCETATDLGRERYFQGAGLVDVCRALQAI